MKPSLKNIIPKREIKDCKTAVLFIFAFYQNYGKLWLDDFRSGNKVK